MVGTILLSGGAGVTMEKNRRGLLIVISGPSGVGKGTICKQLLAKYQDIDYSISATTRKPRAGEKHGREYFFYSQEEFLKLIREDSLLEWAKVYDNYYGTPKKYVEDVLAQGKDCILEIDIQGAQQIKRKMPEGVFIFIAPPSKEELIRRINCRGTETPEEIRKRMGQVEKELDCIDDYDYIVINDNVDTAALNVRAIILAERCRVPRFCHS